MDLAQRIADLAYDLPDALLECLAADLIHHEPDDAASPSGLVSRLSTTTARTKLRDLIAEWNREDQPVSGAGLALALQAAAAAHNRWRTAQSLELVWTGPGPPYSQLRRTDQALLEVIENSSQDLWVVSFAAYKVDAVTTALRRAVDRSVGVTLILESSEHSEGRLTTDGIHALGQDVISRSRVFVWPTDKRPATHEGKRGMLHAKCAVADSRYLFVSSANLTEAALHLNMELGLLVRGGRQPAQVQQHLVWLIENGILAPYSEPV